MCGRKTLSKDITSIIEEMDIEEWEAHGYQPNYNVAPTNFSPVLIKDRSKKTKMMRWGLIPSWSKNDKIGSKLINARLETILEKPSFSSLVNKHRCVVLADGYYEWTKKQNQPYYITSKKNKILPLAGLWTKWESSNSNTIFSYTLITRKPVKSIGHLHNRMPVILNNQKIDEWIDCKQFSFLDCQKDLQENIVCLEHYPVSKMVNSIKNNSIQCIKEKKEIRTINLFSS